MAEPSIEEQILGEGLLQTSFWLHRSKGVSWVMISWTHTCLWWTSNPWRPQSTLITRVCDIWHFLVQHPINWGLMPGSEPSESWLLKMFSSRCGKMHPPSGSWRWRSSKCLARALTTLVPWSSKCSSRTWGVGRLYLQFMGVIEFCRGPWSFFPKRTHWIRGYSTICLRMKFVWRPWFLWGRNVAKKEVYRLVQTLLSCTAKGVSFIANRVSLVGIGSSKKHAVLSVYHFSQYFTVHFVSSKICLPCVSPSILWRA